MEYTHVSRDICRIVQRARTWGTIAVVASVASGMAGCANSVTDSVLPSSGPVDSYWSLSLLDHAINLSVTAPSNVMDLVAIPRNARGVPLTNVTGRPTFVVQDPARLVIDSTGKMTALGTGNGIRLIATWQIQSITHSDTAYVQVTDTAPSSPVSVFTMQPAPGDSAKWSSYYPDFIFGFKRVIPRVYGEDGQPIPVETVANFVPVPGLTVAYTTSNPSALYLDHRTGEIVPAARPGTTTITASTYAYGIRKQDSVVYTIGIPTVGGFAIDSATTGGGVRATPADTIVIGVGGVAYWSSSVSAPTAILFDDPAAASEPSFTPGSGGGDIPVLTSADFFFRQFDHAGRYTFHDAQGTLLGTVIVQAE